MKIRVEKTHNYTVMSNYHLFDKRLSFKAKGLLSFMLSVPDTWEYSVKGLAAMAKDGVASVSAALKELENCGYVSRRQIRSKNGSFKDVEYTIYEKPIENLSENNDVSSKYEHCEPERENPEQAENRQITGTQPSWEKPVSEKNKKSKTEEPISDNPISENPVSENPAQININKSNILTEVNTNPIISYQKDNDDDTIREDYRTYEEIIKENICYEDTVKAQCSDEEMKQVDFMVQLMAETMVSSAPTVRIGKKNLPSALVKSRFMKIWYEDIFAVLRAVKKSKAKIKYFRSYYLTSLYYADHTENIKNQQIFKNEYEEMKE